MRNLPATLCLPLLLAGWFPACSQTAKQPPKEEQAQKADSQILAVVDGTPIREDDLNIRAKLVHLEQQRYELTSEALEDAIGQRLLEKEAARRGVSLEALLESEVNAKAAEPSDAEIEALYERQKQRIRQPLEAVRDQLAAALKAFNASQRRGEFVAGLRKQSQVEVRLEAPRLEVELAKAPLRGPADAPVTVVEFSDFQCPFCKRVQPIIQELRKRYAQQVNWRFKDLPLTSIHSEAQHAAEAARCAGEQGKFWQYRDALFEADQLSDDLHKSLAESLGLERESFLQCLGSEKYREAVESDSEEAQSLGISGTPTFVINGIVLSGAQPLEEFAKVIDKELQRSGAKSQ